jgi:hypothetical protein
MIFSISKIPSPRDKFLMGKVIKNRVPRNKSDTIVYFELRKLSIFGWILLKL